MNTDLGSDYSLKKWIEEVKKTPFQLKETLKKSDAFCDNDIDNVLSFLLPIQKLYPDFGE